MENKSNSAENDSQKSEQNNNSAGGEETNQAPDPEVLDANPESDKALVDPTTVLGNDADGTPKLSVNESLNIVSKSIIHLFAEQAKTSLPKITPTQVEEFMKGQDQIQLNWQFADLKKTKGRIALVSKTSREDYILLPINPNEEYEFGVDYELMAREAAEKGLKFGEEELAKAKAEHEADEIDKNRISERHLGEVAETIKAIFAERETTCLPKLTDKEVQHVLRNQGKTISIETKYTNEDETEGYYELKEFLNVVRVPAEGVFMFGIDNQRIADKLAANQ